MYDKVAARVVFAVALNHTVTTSNQGVAKLTTTEVFTSWCTLVASVMVPDPQFKVTFTQHESGTEFPSGL